MEILAEIEKLFKIQ